MLTEGEQMPLTGPVVPASGSTMQISHPCYSLHDFEYGERDFKSLLLPTSCEPGAQKSVMVNDGDRICTLNCAAPTRP
jgi:hypothetical protein